MTPTVSTGISSLSAWHREHHPRSELPPFSTIKDSVSIVILVCLAIYSLPSIQERQTMPEFLVKLAAGCRRGRE